MLKINYLTEEQVYLHTVRPQFICILLVLMSDKDHYPA